MKTHTIDLVVAKEDIYEPVGHAGYDAYLRYYRDGANALLDETIGANHGNMNERYGVNCSATEAHIKYTKELFEGDRIRVISTIERIGAVNMTYNQRIERDDIVISTAEVVTTFHSGGKAQRIPDEIREKLIAAFPHLKDPE